MASKTVGVRSIRPAPLDAQERSAHWLEALERELGDEIDLERRARRVVEQMALALQASLLVRYGDSAVADAFCASRLGADRSLAYGTLPDAAHAAAIVDRHRPRL